MIERLHGWVPRGLREAAAAEYVGLSDSAFRAEVKAGRAPRPVQITRGRVIWLKDDLDGWLDRLSGRVPNSGEMNPWLA